MKKKDNELEHQLKSKIEVLKKEVLLKKKRVLDLKIEIKEIKEKK